MRTIQKLNKWEDLYQILAYKIWQQVELKYIIWDFKKSAYEKRLGLIMLAKFIRADCHINMVYILVSELYNVVESVL